MATIPDTPIGGKQLRGVPDAAMGPRLNADAFGGTTARQMGQLGQAVQGAGDAMQHYAIRMYEERARNEATQAIVGYETDVSRYRSQVFQSYTGNKAYSTPEDLDEYSRGQAEAIGKNLSTPRARELFEQQRTRYDAHNRLLANQHVIRENEKYRITALEERNAQLLNEAAALPGDPATVMYSISQIQANNHELYRNQPKEFIDRKNAESAMAVVETVASNLIAKHGPEAALAFLDVDDIKNQFTAAGFEEKFGALKRDYQKKAIEAEQKAIIDQGVSQMIVAAKSGDPAVIFEALVREVGLDSALKVASGYEKYASLGTKYANQLSEQEKAEREQRAADEATVARDRARADVQAGKTQQEMRDIAYRDFNEKAAKIYLDTAEAERKALAADAATAAVNEERELLQKLEEVGFVPSRMVSWGRLTLEQKEKANDLAKKHGPSKPETKTDVGKYLDYQNMSDDELLDVFTDPKRRETAVADLGGVGSKWFGNVFDRIDPSKKSTKESKAKTEDITLLDSELNIIKRQADLAALDTGRTLGKEEAEIYSSRIVEDYNAKLEEFMETNELTSVKQIPLADRRRMRAETLLTYKVKTPGVVFDGTRVATEAEARAGGLSTEGAAVVPASLPAEQRKKYPGSGKVYRIQDEVGNDMMVVRNVSPDSAPEPVRTAAQTAGPGAVISRELETGEWTVAGPRFYQEYRADGTEIPKRFGETERAATERRLDEDDYLAEMAEPGENPWMTNARLFEERRSAGE